MALSGTEDDEWPSPEDFQSFRDDPVEAVMSAQFRRSHQRATAVEQMRADYWLVDCEQCDFILSGLESREEAIIKGREHVNNKHGDDEEWSFHVQGIRRNNDAAKEHI